jgi:hypothetical protein
VITAAAYILKIPENRREILLNPPNMPLSRRVATVAEPVPSFEHSRRAPLIVFGCFDDDAITHIADGRRGASAGTGLVRLNMWSLQSLPRPIQFRELLDRAPARVRQHLGRTLAAGGKLPPKSRGAVVDAIIDLQPDLSDRLTRFSDRREALLRLLTASARTNLAFQKETLAAALEIAQMGTESLLTWAPDSIQPRSFLDGIPGAYVREDAAIIADFSNIPGFEAIKNQPFAAKVFQNPQNPSIRLTVIMANRLPLEQQTGADLIYYNETYRSFVMVQYKAMDQGAEGPEFRWRPDDQLAEEIARIDELLIRLKELASDANPVSFRLHSNPFFLKLCPRIILNPDDKGLFKGMYLPLDLWKCLASHPTTEGPRGGRLLTYENVGRKLTNAEFVMLVANAWIGTTVPQSVILEAVIRSVIETGKTVTLAVKSQDTETTGRHISGVEWEDEVTGQAR